MFKIVGFVFIGSCILGIIFGKIFNSSGVGWFSAVISFFFLFAMMLDRLKQQEIDDTKALYDQALASGDKRLALKYGRQYYGSLREDGRLTTYDEQAIQNDLLSIDN